MSAKILPKFYSESSHAFIHNNCFDLMIEIQELRFLSSSKRPMDVYHRRQLSLNIREGDLAINGCTDVRKYSLGLSVVSVALRPITTPSADLIIELKI